MVEKAQDIKQIVLAVGVGVLFVAFSAFVFSYLYSNGLAVSEANLDSTTLGARAFQDIALGVMFPVVLIACYLAKGQHLSFFGLNSVSLKAVIVLAVLYVVLFLIIGSKTPAGVYMWFYYLLVIAFSEEVVFRGFVFLRIYETFGKTRKGAVIGCVVSGALWGAAHGVIPAITSGEPFFLVALSYVGGYTLFSVVFTYALVTSRTLFVPILIHAALDYLSVASSL